VVLDRFPRGELRRVVLPVLVVYAFAWFPFVFVGDPSKMVRLQSAGSESAARSLVGAWPEAELVDLAFLVGVDFVHIVAYSVLLAAGAVWAGRRLKGRASRLSPGVIGLVVGAALSDVGENVGLVSMIRGALGGPVAPATRLCSLAKSVLLGVVLVYLVAGCFARGRADSGSGRGVAV
jgi:hypothetical protein